MHKLTFVLLALAATLPAQNFLTLPASANPSTTELPDYNLRPFMQTNSRVQMFFSATEAGQSTFTATAMSLRYDGPIPQVGAPGPFTIQRLKISVGASAVPLPSANFASNLTQAITTAFDAPWSYLPDPGFGYPHPWGDPSNSLTIPFATPVAVTIPANGWLVIDLQMTGNNIANFGFSHAIVDGVRTTGGVSNGLASNYGQGCSASSGGAAATISTTGTYAPGAAHFLGGQNLGANTLVFAIAGVSNTSSPFGALPWSLPGTACQLLASADLTLLLQSDANGAIPANQQGAALSVPANAVFGGLQLFEQLIAYAPGANAYDLISSDGRTIALGSIAPPLLGIYTVSHGSLADATIADKVDPFGYAVRLQIQ